MIQSVIKAFVYSNLFVASTLTALTLSTYSIVHVLQFHWYVPCTVFLGTFVLYGFHRLYKVDFIPSNQLGERHKWVIRRSNPMKVAMSIAMFLLMLLLPNLNADTVVWLIPAGMVSVGYTIPMMPTAQGWQRFRDIPMAKPFIITLVVTYLTLAYPLFEQGGIASIAASGILQLFAERFLFLLAVTVPFEMRDIVNDRDAGIQTLGTQLGFERSKRVGLVVVAAWTASVLVRYFYAGGDPFFLIPSLLLMIFVILGYWKMKVQWNELRYILVFEGAIVLYAIANAMEWATK